MGDPKGDQGVVSQRPLAGPGARTLALMSPAVGSQASGWRPRQRYSLPNTSLDRPHCLSADSETSPGSRWGLGASPSSCARSASWDQRTVRDNPGHLRVPGAVSLEGPLPMGLIAGLGRGFAVCLGLAWRPGLPQALRQGPVASREAGAPSCPSSALPGSGPTTWLQTCLGSPTLPGEASGSRRSPIQQQPPATQDKEPRF